MSAADDRYNHSEKGRARWRLYYCRHFRPYVDVGVPQFIALVEEPDPVARMQRAASMLVCQGIDLPAGWSLAPDDANAEDAS